MVNETYFYYTCYFCGNRINYPTTETVYAINTTPDSGKGYICMCENCLNKLKYLLNNVPEDDFNESRIWYLLESDELSKVREGVNYLYQLPFSLNTLYRLQKISKNCTDTPLKNSIDDYLKLYKINTKGDSNE